MQITYSHIRGELYRNIFVPVLKKEKYNNLFWKKYYWLEKTKSWNLRQFREYQMQELQKQIKHAYKNTIYYKRLFDERGWKPEQFQNFTDFKKIPILTKKDMQEHFEELRALPRRMCYIITTGGSTGIPTKIYQETNVTDNVYRAFVWQWYNEGGYYPGDKAAIIRGSIIKNGSYEFYEKRNELHCFSMKMTKENMKNYLEQMEKNKVTAICAYPSSAELLTRFVKDTGIGFNENGRIKTLFTSSETLTLESRKMIERYLHVKVLDLYGNSEQMGMIGQFRDGLYHEYMCHSYVEYLDENNNPVINGKAKIVATGLINNAMPMLRYDTNDFAEVLSEQKTKRYNSQKVIKNVRGRWKTKDLVIAKDGNFVSMAAINTHADIFDNIYKLQFVQEEKGKIKLNILPGEHFSIRDKELIYQEFHKRFGEGFELSICVTNQFEYTRRGKDRLLVQKLNIC